MNKVSIIVPIYNAEKTIKRCIDSILNQSYKNFELLLINDGSKDQSLEIIKEYKDKRIVVIDKKNEGVAKTRNLGIKKATGDYIMFIDNDDYIDSDYVDTYVNEIINSKSDLVIGGYRRVNNKKKILFYKSPDNYPWTKYIIMAPWAKIFRKKVITLNHIEFLDYCIGEDVYFILSLLSFNPKVSIISYIGYNWYYNDESISNTVQKGMRKDVNVLYLLNKINDFYIEKDEYINYYFYKYYVWYLLFSGRSSSKEKFLREHVNIKNWLKEKNIKNTISPLSIKLKGESFSHRISVLLFLWLDKLHLMNLFATIYCKGGKNE